ncbi:helix-turn-helix domain-containing protein [Nocardia takedensis]|uniref:helix-turn-helix domain-containing protein n=1 Tax=Nocardia takedensis TaxID=259390 RepID=UPI0012F6D94C|nr:helix-turn-helix transcriptional regulator [Nocardia takedensis]
MNRATTDRCADAGLVKSLYSQEHLRFCAVMRRLRVDSGLTQSELAARLGKPQSFVSKYETGERRLDVAEARAVAAALGTSLREVVAELGW